MGGPAPSSSFVEYEYESSQWIWDECSPGVLPEDEDQGGGTSCTWRDGSSDATQAQDDHRDSTKDSANDASKGANSSSSRSPSLAQRFAKGAYLAGASGSAKSANHAVDASSGTSWWNDMGSNGLPPLPPPTTPPPGGPSFGVGVPMTPQALDPASTLNLSPKP